MMGVVHDNWITKIQFYEDLGTLVTSSTDNTIAFVDWIETEKYGNGKCNWSSYKF